MGAWNLDWPANGQVVKVTASILLAAGTLAGCGGGGADDEPVQAASVGGVTASSERESSAAATATAVWTKVAGEGNQFVALTTTPVIYGTSTKWVKLRLSGTYTCNAATFGSDPAPGETKECHAKSTSTSGTAILEWTASGDTGVTGHRVYYGSRAGTYLQPLGSGYAVSTGTAFGLAGLTPGSAYYFAVTSTGAAGQESDYSNEASKVIPKLTSASK
jgi:hypothetical protein